MSWSQRACLGLLFWVCCAATWLRRLAHAGGFFVLFLLIVIGLPREASNPLSDPALQVGVSTCLRRYNLHCPRQRHEQFLPVKLLGGYNCRGYIWAGPARIETIRDTGSTRNSTDQEFLQAPLQNESTQGCVRDVFDIEPLLCASTQRGRTFKIRKMALVDVTFKESSGVRARPGVLVLRLCLIARMIFC